MRYIAFITLVLSLFTSCEYRYRTRGGIVQKIVAEPIVEEILKYSVELKYEYNLFLHDARIVYDDSVEKICIDLRSQDILEMCAARELLVDVTEGLLKKLNSSPEAKSQMLKNMFTYYDLNIVIEYESDFIEYVDFMYVGWITLRNGMATYYAGDINSDALDFWHARTEPYYKSRQFVKILRGAETHYKATHPVEEEQSIFKKGSYAPVDWESQR